LYKDVKEDLSDFLESRMDQLWKDGIIGADFLVAAIGSSVQVFGEYERVIREDSTVRADTFLDDVRRIVTDYAIKQVLHNGLASEISGLTRFYVLWRWAYGEDAVIFDDARKLAQVCGIDLTSQWGKTFIQKDKEIISVLGPYQRRFSDIESLDTKDMIDIMHMALLLWEKGNKNALIDLLRDTGYGSKDAFKRVAQAIAETLPKGTKEKLLLEGFLNALGRLGDEVREGEKQTRLFE
jgi:adenine-specific DNA methylase